jgi:CheY-like chemotaxis protein
MKILLVDDDVFLRDMYAAKFTEQGDSVVSVENGTQAIQALVADSFDAVLLDMVMPGMDGIALLQKIANTDIQGQPKCIVLSNQSEDTDLKKAHDAGAVGYLIKAELIPSEVVQKVHSIV